MSASAIEGRVDQFGKFQVLALIVCSCSSKLQVSPSGSYSRRRRSNIAFSKVVPNPWRLGGTTAGPPRSRHCNLTTISGPFLMIFHLILTRPCVLDNAPCLTALVHSSCSASEILSVFRTEHDIAAVGIDARSKSL